MTVTKTVYHASVDEVGQTNWQPVKTTTVTLRSCSHTVACELTRSGSHTFYPQGVFGTTKVVWEMTNGSDNDAEENHYQQSPLQFVASYFQCNDGSYRVGLTYA